MGGVKNVVERILEIVEGRWRTACILGDCGNAVFVWLPLRSYCLDRARCTDSVCEVPLGGEVDAQSGA